MRGRNYIKSPSPSISAANTFSAPLGILLVSAMKFQLGSEAPSFAYHATLSDSLAVLSPSLPVIAISKSPSKSTSAFF